MTIVLDRSVLAVSGNPRPRSRTLTVAQVAADQIAQALDLARASSDLDLADIAGQLFAADAPDADHDRGVLARSTVAVIATPVYKASFTGLLKAFLDRYPGGGLQGVLAIPVVVSASPAHSFVGEYALRPLLAELGAWTPTRALAVVESQLDDIDQVVARWLADAAPTLARLVPISAERAAR